MKKIFTIFFILISTSVFAQPTIDGILSDGDYSEISSFSSGNDGFGGDSDLGGLVYYADGTNMYFGIKGELAQSGDNHNFVIFMNFSGYIGHSAGTALPAASSTIFAGIGGTILDFEVDFAFAFNKGNSSSDFYCDAVRYGSSNNVIAANFEGNTTSQSGVPASFDPTSTTGGTAGNMTIAFRNTFSSNTDHGLEVSIPISTFAGVTNVQNVQFFVGIVAASGYWSNELLPDIPISGTADGSGNFGFDPNFQTAAGGNDLFTGAQPLPVELTTFTANVFDGKVKLSWETATEVDNYGFEVERLKLGDRSKESEARWNNIGFVVGHGNSNSPKEYSFVDDSPASNVVKYRLKQIDIDGAYEYSNEIEVTLETIPAKFELAQNYPNPFNPSTVIKFNIPETNGMQNTHVKLEVFDVLGKRVAVLVNENLSADSYERTFNANGLSSGIYYYQLTTPEFSNVKKMILVR
ncbi:MAG: T9SS type A sorting domain-containing protein [Melioribacteraceae bacterium]|nr:T9SS type A sorting domain-containing protein [Melioribacteraceae bacterium]